MSNPKDDDYVPPSWSFTQKFTKHVRGVAPQHLIDTATRHRIYGSPYWNQYCFGVNLKIFVDRMMNIKGVGGVYGMFRDPCNFLCLFLKLLELEPSRVVIDKFLKTKSWQSKYLRLIAALYVRFTYPMDEVYLILESMLGEYTKVSVLREEGYVIDYFDNVINDFLTKKFWCGITFPPLTPRVGIPERESLLNHMRELIRQEEFAKLGMNPDGVLFEVLEAKENPAKKLKLKSKKNLVKKPQTPKNVSTADDTSIEEENKLRAMLGLKPLR